MTIVAHVHPFVIGVDTHARTHTLAVVSASTGYPTVEAPRTNTLARRGLGKSGPLDAQAIATAALSTDLTALRHPHQDDGTRAALRVLVAARDQMTVERTANVNALLALVRTVDLGIDARKPLNDGQIDEIARWRARSESLAPATARAEAVRLTKRVLALTTELEDNQSRTAELIQASEAAPLLDETGIGPVIAAVVLTAWSHPGRVRAEAALAALAGVNRPTRKL